MIRYHKNPRQTQVVVSVDGVSYPAKYIGKGNYSRVFRVGDRVVFYTRGDCGKEVLAMYQYNRIAHLPELIRHQNINKNRKTQWYVFSSPFYRNVTSKDTSAWKLMKKIVKDYDKFFAYWYTEQGFRGVDVMQGVVNDFEHDKDIPRSVVKALQEIVEIGSNCGYRSVGFDLHKGNFGVNAYGTLIFRDPIWVRE